MQQLLVDPIADATSSVFSPEPSVLARAPGAAAARIDPSARAAALGAAENERWAADHSPISDRFCSAVALSALLAFGSAPLLAHGAAIDSMLAVGCGVSCFIGGVLLHVVERRRAIGLLTRSAIERGLDGRTAQLRARETLQRWLS